MEVYNIKPIYNILAQRPPFVFVDGYIELIENQKIVAVKNVTYNEAYMPAHFPGNTIMPGALIIEAAAQAASILCKESRMINIEQDEFLVLGGVQRFTFKRPALPGDILLIEVEIMKAVERAYLAKVNVKVESDVIAEGQLSLGVRRNDQAK